jgi:hypothetical protein
MGHLFGSSVELLHCAPASFFDRDDVFEWQLVTDPGR